MCIYGNLRIARSLKRLFRGVEGDGQGDGGRRSTPQALVADTTNTQSSSVQITCADEVTSAVLSLLPAVIYRTVKYVWAVIVPEPRVHSAGSLNGLGDFANK